MEDLEEKFLKNMFKLKKEDDDDDDDDKGEKQANVKLFGKSNKPEKLRQGFFPRVIKGDVLVMTKKIMETPLMRTFIFGAISHKCSEEMWENDAKVFGDRFLININNIDIVTKLKWYPADEAGRVLDTSEAIGQIYDAVDVLNKVKEGEPIRIVHIGSAESNFFFQGVEYLLKSWHPNSSCDKLVQFVTTGDSKSKMYEEFCKSLVLRNFCTSIEFYNCQDYHPFGDYSYSRN